MLEPNFRRYGFLLVPLAVLWFLAHDGTFSKAYADDIITPYAPETVETAPMTVITADSAAKKGSNTIWYVIGAVVAVAAAVAAGGGGGNGGGSGSGGGGIGVSW